MALASKKLSRFNITSLALGLAFLYLPIVILMIYSFNASRLVTVWGGWSLRWYTEFFNDSAMIDAAWMSLRVAATSATLATLLGTLAAVALARGGGFQGADAVLRHALCAAGDARSHHRPVAAAVVRGAQRRARLLDRVHRPHHADPVLRRGGGAGAPWRARPQPRGSGDGSRLRSFARVPGGDAAVILPSIAAGWMLAFTLSLDDLVIASFTTGPGSSTLPIRIYSEVRLGVKPEINAICTLVVGADRGGDRRRIAGLETVGCARQERRAIVVASFRAWR